MSASVESILLEANRWHRVFVKVDLAERMTVVTGSMRCGHHLSWIVGKDEVTTPNAAALDAFSELLLLPRPCFCMHCEDAL